MSCDSDAEGQEALREQESYRLGDGQPPFLRRRTLDAQESVEVVGLQGFAIANQGPIAVSGDAQAAAGQAFISAASVSAGEAVVSEIALAVALGNQASSANGPMAAPPVDAQESVAVADGDDQMAAQRVRRRAYSLQFSDTQDPARRRPCMFTRESFAEFFERRHQDFFRERTRHGQSGNSVVKVMVFKELHDGGGVNYYAGILCERPYRPNDIQRAVQEDDRVYLSFGFGHAFFWTIAVYGGVPSIHKAAAEIDKDPYHSQGRTVREELADIPRGARLVDKQRVREFLGLGPKGKASQAKGMTIDEFAEQVRDNGWRSQTAVLRAAGASRASAPALYEAVLRFGAKRIDEVIGIVWAMEGDDLEPAACRVEALLAAPARLPCICSGKWQRAAQRLLEIQHLDSVAVRKAVVRGLRWGRNKWTNVLVVGEPDGGKSLILKPLSKIYKTFIRRGQNETFALQGIHGSEICLLQDVRYETFGLP